MLEQIDNSARRSEPLLRVYDGRCVLNRHASDLLGITEGDRVEFLKDTEAERCGRLRLYVCRTFPNRGYVVRQRNHTCRIDCASLARKLSENLEGEGTYRICPEDSLENGGRTCYSIFFRKYRGT